MRYVVVFASTGNALLRPGCRNWQTVQDMLDRVETDGIVAPSKTSAAAQSVSFSPGTSGLKIVSFDDWVESMS